MRRPLILDKPMELNITSLMDIMTIILIFLIMSYDSQEQEVTPPENIQLPASSAERPVKLAVKLSVSPEEVWVEGKSVVKLHNGKFRPTDLNSDRRVRPLLRELERQKGKLLSGSASQAQGEEDERDLLYLEAARGTPFDLVDQVLKTAATAGFTKFRLAVFRKG